MAVDQLLVSAASRDAITNAARAARTLLGRVAPSRLLAQHLEPGLEGEVERIAEAGDPGGPPLVYHASIGEASVHRYLTSVRRPLAVWYHNITPPQYFSHDQRFARLLESGRAHLARLAARTEVCWTESEYNERDARRLGFADVRRAPLLLDHDRLVALEPHAPTAHHFAESVDGPVLLFVGQLLPHKRPDLLIRAYDLLVTHHVPEAHLVIVGPHRDAGYAATITRLVRELQLRRCWVVGGVPDDVLSAMYRAATVFVTASSHEGFCVPLVEAMAFGLPVIAVDAGAVGETLGGAGLLLPEDVGAELLCEAMLAALEDAALRANLAARSHERVGAFGRDVAELALLENVAALL